GPPFGIHSIFVFPGTFFRLGALRRKVIRAASLQDLIDWRITAETALRRSRIFHWRGHRGVPGGRERGFPKVEIAKRAGGGQTGLGPFPAASPASSGWDAASGSVHSMIGVSRGRLGSGEGISGIERCD